MRYAYRVALDCEQIGARVTVRYALPEGGATDVVGILESCDQETFGVRDRRGNLRLISRARVVAAKVVPPPRSGTKPGPPGVL